LERHPALFERLARGEEAVAAALEGPEGILYGYLICPIQAEGRMIGMLGLLDRNPGKRWAAWDRHLLRMVGGTFRLELARQRSDQQRKRSELRSRLLASHFPNGMVLMFDARLRFLVAEGEVGSKLGLTAERLEGRTLEEVFLRERVDLLAPLFRRALAGESLVEEIPFGQDMFEVRLVPVRTGEGKVTAGMAVFQVITERKRVEEHLRHAREALEEARNQETAIAAEIQRSLLLGRPLSQMPQVDMDVISLPSMQVDGDFYDFFYIRERMFDLVVGDVMGKGVPAAMIGAAARVSFLRAMGRLLARGRSYLPEPDALLGMVHGELAGRLAGFCSFITLAYARFDLARGILRTINCGHPPVLVHRVASGEILPLESTHPPLGIGDSLRYSIARTVLRPGDRVVFISDGVTEARNEAHEFFGEGRLRSVILDHPHAASRQVTAAIRDAVMEFVGAAGLRDDFTCLIVTYTG